MYGLLNHLNSAALFTAAAAYPKWCLRYTPIYRSLSATAGFGKTYKRKRLPVELSGRVTMLTCESAARRGVCDVYLIGTMHRYPKSCEDVRLLIRLIKPEVVFLELCPSRAKGLKPKPYQCEMTSWGEFQVAYEEANKYGAKVVFGDRPFGITVRRLPLMKFLWNFIFSDQDYDTELSFYSKLKNGKIIPNVNRVHHASCKVAKDFPSFVETFVHERDRYMSVKLLEVTRKHSSVVAVVGMAHVPGIQKNLKQPVDVDMKQLLHVPIVKRIFTTVRGIGATVAIISGIYLLKDVM